METVESPLEVLSRAATMVQHCRTYSSADQHDDMESVDSGSPCGSNASASPPSVKDSVTTTSSDIAAVKQLPSSKWRRERRCTTRIPDYKHRENGTKASRSQSFNDKSTAPRVQFDQISRTRSGDNNLHHSDSDLSQYDESNDEAEVFPKKKLSFASSKGARGSKPPEYIETPLDMSVKIRSSPPSYSQSVNSGHLYRPSVITQTNTNGSNSSSPTLNKLDVGKGEYVPGSMSMCDPVIDEHFRRSLGADYMSLFNKKEKEANGISNGKTPKAPMKDRASSPIMFASDPCSKYLTPNNKPAKEPEDTVVQPLEVEDKKEDCKMEVDDDAGMTVDDHFAKALGDTWKKLQEKKQDSKSSDSEDKKDLASSNHDKKRSRSIFI